MKREKSILVVIIVMLLLLGSSLLASAGTELTWWGWYPTQEIMNDIKVMFEEEYPEVTLHVMRFDYDTYVNRLRSDLVAGTGPDILSMQVGALLNAMEPFLLDLNQHLGDWVEMISPGSMDQAWLWSGEEKLYLIPLAMSAQMYVFYNHTLFEEAGVEIPTNLDEFIDVSLTLKEVFPNKVPFAIGLGDNWFATDFFMMLANMAEPGITERADAGEVKWTSEPFVRAMEALVNLVHKGVIQRDAVGLSAYEGAIGMHLDRQAPMFAMGSWNVGNLSLEYGDRRGGRATDDDILSAFVMPNLVDPVGDPVVIGGIDLGISINQQTQNLEYALKLIEFMAVGEGQDHFAGRPGAGAIPVLKTLTRDMSPYQHPVEQAGAQMFIDAYNNYMVGAREVSDTEVKDQLAIEIQNIINGKDIGQALNDIQRIADRVRR